MTTTQTIHEQNDIERIMENAREAFCIYKTFPLQKRSGLLRAIAAEIELLGDALIHTCMADTNLTEPRLRNERTRTCFQLNSYADACEQGDWLQARIDTADDNRTPVKPSIRKTMIPLGPVVVFGASNFPFAFSTAGADTASALAAGCPVIVKAHPAHLATSLLIAAAIDKAIFQQGLPAAIFTHITDTSIAAGQMLVIHPHTKAVGFTGSFSAGKSIRDLAGMRAEPIPVFAEMSSINPVFLLPEKLQEEATSIAQLLAGSITLGAGQFCTKPGIIFGIAGKAFDAFINSLSSAIKNTAPVYMLHEGIAKNFRTSRDLILGQPGVYTAGQSSSPSQSLQDIPSLAFTTAEAFLGNSQLQTEVFGSFSLVISCRDATQMLAAAKALCGQLTITLMATVNDLNQHTPLIETVKTTCGRLIVNNVPTGVEVGAAMQHGGPWPSSSDSRFTSVGADAIQRFVRPLSFQNWPDALLPDELKDNNPLKIWRTVNNQLTKEPLS